MCKIHIRTYVHTYLCKYVRTYGTNKTCNTYAYNIYAHTSRTYNYTYMYECRLKLPTYIRIWYKIKMDLKINQLMVATVYLKISACKQI